MAGVQSPSPQVRKKSLEQLGWAWELPPSTLERVAKEMERPGLSLEDATQITHILGMSASSSPSTSPPSWIVSRKCPTTSKKQALVAGLDGRPVPLDWRSEFEEGPRVADSAGLGDRAKEYLFKLLEETKSPAMRRVAAKALYPGYFKNQTARMPTGT